MTLIRKKILKIDNTPAFYRCRFGISGNVIFVITLMIHFVSQSYVLTLKIHIVGNPLLMTSMILIFTLHIFRHWKMLGNFFACNQVPSAFRLVETLSSGIHPWPKSLSCHSYPFYRLSLKQMNLSSCDQGIFDNVQALFHNDQELLEADQHYLV